MMYTLIFLLLVAFAFLYIRIAKQYGIVDVPNDRTMHKGAVIRGGGILFFMAVILHALFFYPTSWYFVAGLTLLVVISFVDDLGDMPRRLRSLAQLIAVLIIIYDIGFFSNFFLAIALLILFIGILNAFNFMDGINGITGGYAAITLASFIWINEYQIAFIDSKLLWIVLLSTLIFNFLNFRKKAICFAGDVGSIGNAFILSYFMLLLFYMTASPLWILMFALYGVDSVLTIVHRLMRRDNIFEPHKLHLFQVGVYKGGLSHLQMSGIFAIGQLMVNIAMLYLIKSNLNLQWQIIYGVCILLFLGGIQIFIKSRLLNRDQT